MQWISWKKQGTQCHYLLSGWTGSMLLFFKIYSFWTILWVFFVSLSVCIGTILQQATFGAYDQRSHVLPSTICPTVLIFTQPLKPYPETVFTQVCEDKYQFQCLIFQTSHSFFKLGDEDCYSRRCEMASLWYKIDLFITKCNGPQQSDQRRIWCKSDQMLTHSFIYYEYLVYFLFSIIYGGKLFLTNVNFQFLWK